MIELKYEWRRLDCCRPNDIILPDGESMDCTVVEVRQGYEPNWVLLLRTPHGQIKHIVGTGDTPIIARMREA